MKSANMRLRFALLTVAIAAMFALMVVRLYDLQLRNFETYGTKAEASMTKTFTLKGSRGQIQDANGEVLAYDKKIYNVQFYREPSSSRSNYIKSIWDVIAITEAAGKKTIATFWLREDDDGEWVFDVGLGIHMEADGVWQFNEEPKPNENGVIPTQPSSDTIKAANSRVSMFRTNFYCSEKKAQTPADVFAFLCDYYSIDKFNETLTTKLTNDDKRKILAVWQEMQMNAFLSKPVTIAQDVPWSTALEIEMRSITLTGISIAVGTQRVYPKGTLACHLLGYVGPIPANWWNSNPTDYTGKGYAMSDWIGLDGVERTQETWLSGSTLSHQGSKTVQVNYEGRVMSELSQTPATDGSTVKLTIRSDLQRVAETALAKAVNDIRTAQEATIKRDSWLEENKEVIESRNFEKNPLSLAQNGAIVVLDMQARVLAMASFPDYDPNLFVIGMNEAQQERMLNDPRHPLFNNAIGSRDTPGSIFKMTTALAGLTVSPEFQDNRSVEEKNPDNRLYKAEADYVQTNFTVNTRISDTSPFRMYDTVNPPSCWANTQTRLTKHSDQTVVQGLANSCNYFFYNVASALGEYDQRNGLTFGETLYGFAAKLGLTSKTNIDLPGEIKSVVGSQLTLYDPTRAISETAQDTAIPTLVRASLKAHLRRVGEKYNYTYTDERLDKCVKALLDMAYYTNQSSWVSSIRVVLMQELGMPREIVVLAATVNDIYTALNEVKWGGSQSIMTAIGQSITLLTPISVARYVVAIANGGYVYDVSLIDTITSPTGEVQNPLDHPVIIEDLSAQLAPYLPYIKQGMHDVVSDGTAQSQFDNWAYTDQIGGKTGTAEKSLLDVENNAWFVAFAPYEKPEIAVVVYVPNGMAAGNVIPPAKSVIEAYMNSRVDLAPSVVPSPNTLAP